MKVVNVVAFLSDAVKQCSAVMRFFARHELEVVSELDTVGVHRRLGQKNA